MPVFRPCEGRTDQGSGHTVKAAPPHTPQNPPPPYPQFSTYQLPTIEVHAGQFAVVRLCDVDVQRLALIDVRAAICCHLEDGLLRDFPHCFVQPLQIVGDLRNILSANQESLRRKFFFYPPPGQRDDVAGDALPGRSRCVRSADSSCRRSTVPAP